MNDNLEGVFGKPYDTDDPATLDTLRRPYWEEPDYQEWLNELGENMPDRYDGDDAMEAIVLRYVRDLEAIKVAAVAVAFGAEGVENMDALRALVDGEAPAT